MLVDYRILEREYLLAISRALTAELELNDVLRIIVRACVEFIAARAGMIVLIDPGDQTFRVAVMYGLPPRVVEKHVHLLRAVPYRAGEEREVIPQLTQRMMHIARAADLGLSEVLPLPMVSGEALVGVIYVFRSSEFRFRDDDAQLLYNFANQAAIAVKNARLYEAVNAERQRLHAILEQSADGVMILDAQLDVTVFNSALSRMTGWPADSAIGRPHDEVIQWERLKTDMDLSVAVANGWPLPGAAHLYVEGDLQRRGQETISLGVTYAPLTDPRGHLHAIIANVRDLTRFREQEQLQKTFISVVSHELKTPVSIIKGYAGTLWRQDANWPAEVQDEYLQVIEDESDRLTDLIDDLLEASRLQSGSFKLDMSDDVFLPHLAESVARKFSNPSDNHHLTVDFPDGFPTVCGDERRLTQVLNNLVSNAIKYSPDGGTVEIRGDVFADYVTVAVTDAGIGIPGHEKHRIFQKFSRLDNALSRKTEGTGLGLFLTRAIVEAHRGRIWFDSPGEGCGTTFTFSLPGKGRSSSPAPDPVSGPP